MNTAVQKNSNVDNSSLHVAKQSNNNANLNSSVAYLNFNNNSSNNNTNNESHLVTQNKLFYFISFQFNLSFNNECSFNLTSWLKITMTSTKYGREIEVLMVVTKRFMVRAGNLFNKICTMDNMWEAYYNATKGKKHYREVKEISKNPESFLRKLLYQLKNHKYKTSKYTIFHLYSGGKLREIYKLPMRDRIVQHALMNYLEPLFRKSFITDTYSSIKGRGIHMGMERIRKALKDKENTKYCLKIDIKKFYPSIDLNKLKEVIRRKIKDKDLLLVLDEIIDSCDNGVPIGNYTSQYFANYFLTPFDHWIKEKLLIKYYFRYCDDIVVLGKDKDSLKQTLIQIQTYLQDINLDTKPNWLIFPVQSRGVDFLGYIFRSSYVLLRKHTKNKFIHKVTTLRSYIKRKRILGSYWGIVCHADCRNLWSKYTGVKSFEDFGLLYKDVATATRALGEPLKIFDYKTVNKRNMRWTYMSAEYYNRPIVIKTLSKNLKNLLQNKTFPFATVIISHERRYSFS